MELKITGTLLLDLESYIQGIEASFGPYMLPDVEGMYLPGQVEPILRRDRTYFYTGLVQNEVVSPVPYIWGEKPVDDLFDSNADLVLSKRQIKLLRQTSPYTVRTRDMAVEIIDHLIQHHARWTNSTKWTKRGGRHSNPHGAIRPFLVEPLQRSGIDIDNAIPVMLQDHEDRQWRSVQQHQLDPINVETGLSRLTEIDKSNFYLSQEICNGIMLMLDDPVQQLLDFLGTDRWIMHFTKVNNTQMTVERTIDYRIYSWMQEHGRAYDD